MWLVMSIVCFALSPVLLALAALASAVTGRPQAPIFARLVVAYFALELATLIACGALWLASCGGLLMGTQPFQRLHYRLLRWFVHGFASRWLALLDIDVPAQEPTEATRALESDRPLLFFSRHAGPGDTILLIDRLLTRFDRFPSVVFKQSVAIDPYVDLIGHRLPHAALDTSDQQECEALIEKVANGSAVEPCCCCYPREATSLPSAGVRRFASCGAPAGGGRPPEPTACHTCFRLGPPGLWPRYEATPEPMNTHMWLSPAAEHSVEPDAQVAWIYDWWKRLDEWIEDQGTEPHQRNPGVSPDRRDTAR